MLVGIANARPSYRRGLHRASSASRPLGADGRGVRDHRLAPHGSGRVGRALRLYLWIAAIFGLVNAIIGTILRILTLPLTIITLGLSAVVVNAVLLNITDGLTDT